MTVEIDSKIDGLTSEEVTLLKRAANKLQLVVGAFVTREGAEKQKTELQSKGISNQIVRR